LKANNYKATSDFKTKDGPMFFCVFEYTIHVYAEWSIDIGKYGISSITLLCIARWA